MKLIGLEIQQNLMLKNLLNGDLDKFRRNAVSGGNTTTGAQVLQETNAQLIGAGGNFASGDYSSIDVTQNETVTIDNVTLTIDWNSELTCSRTERYSC